MYGDKITAAMRSAIDITNARRQVQTDYNTKHKITPMGIFKKIGDVMEGARDDKAGRGRYQVAEDSAEYDVLTPAQLFAKIDKLEKQMYKHARDLEFEVAAQLRNQIDKLRQKILVL